MVLVVLSVLSLFVGVIDLRPGKLLRDAEALELLFLSRIPRLAAVLITGSSLAIAGTIMQMLICNRFVEPMTVGAGQGAALGILLVTLFLPGASLLMKIAFASAVAFSSSVIFLALAQHLPPARPFMIALIGMIYGGIINAAVVFVAYQADLLQYIGIWMNGEFSGVLQGRYETLWLAALVAGLCYLVADQFSIVGMGRTASVNLGLNYMQVVILGLIAVSMVSAVTAVTVGMLPFIGLIVPNIVSRMQGDNLRASLPITAVLGAGLVLGADILSRTLRAPFEIPVGTVLGGIGAALFIWLLYRPVPYAR